MRVALIIAALVTTTALNATKGQKPDLEDMERGCIENQNLSDCYSLGYLAEKQDRRDDAVKFYEMVCRGGSWSTCITLGNLEQRSGRTDRAAKWFGLACNDNKATGDGCYAQALLAQETHAGQVTVEALLAKACKKGLKKAC